jgi:formate hydrogenlyase subunit 3/multisubunit Na+/H+ antiporter MnhD subunit
MLITGCVVLGVWAEPVVEGMQAVARPAMDVPAYVSAVLGPASEMTADASR